VTTLPSPSAGNQLHAEGDAEIADIADRVALLGHNLRNSRDRPSIALRIEAQSAHSGGAIEGFATIGLLLCSKAAGVCAGLRRALAMAVLQ
jgi:hypothetical protein